MTQVREHDRTGFDYALGLVGGNASALARICGCSPQAVWQWKKTGLIPHDRAKHLAKTFRVPREKLNPVVFGKD